MPERKSAGQPAKRPVNEKLAALLERAIGRHDDFILTFEEDDRGSETLHVISGKYVTDCMLRKLMGQAESQKDEGAVVFSRKLRKKR